MFLKAGLLSLALLLASRLLGLLRESAQAAAFGASGLADAVILMLTLPDLLTGLLAAGALSYVLLPHWAHGDPAAVAASQRRVGRWLLAAGSGVALALVVASQPLAHWLAPGVPPDLQPLAAQGLWWSAAALPAALLAALWATRLLHERDFAGMYGANLVINGVLVVALFSAMRMVGGAALAFVGVALAIGAVARLLWLALRQRRHGTAEASEAAAPLPHPSASVWLWAVVAAGAPLALPFAARSFASQGGEGALAVFNYGWKLVELPLQLAVQLVATLAFPAVARALAPQAAPGGGNDAVRRAFALSWTLACGAAAALLWGADAWAHLLFQWGRMDAESLEEVAHWARIGAWGLLPQAVLAVVVMVLAAQQRLRPVAWVYGLALALLVVSAVGFGLKDGASLMAVLNAVLTLAAMLLAAAVAREAAVWVPWRAVVAAAGALAVLEGLRLAMRGSVDPAGIAAALLSLAAAVAVGACTWLASADLRQALAR